MENKLAKPGEVITVLTCILLPFVLFQFREFVYFRDYAIIFDGAYRLYLGETPYVDFGVPLGIVSFVLPAILFKIFGPSWDVLFLTQQILNTCTLLLFYILTIQIDVPAITRRISLVLFSIFYLTLLTHPWYNSLGLTFVLAATLFGIKGDYVSIVLSGLCSGAAIFTKQDFGVLAVGISIMCILFYMPTPRFLQSRHETFSLIKGCFLKVILFSCSFLLFAFVYVLLMDFAQFKYWFNYGQFPHEIRGNSLIIYLFFIVAALCLLFSLRRGNNRLLISVLFIFAAVITSKTSGLRFTHYYYIGFLPILLSEIYKIKLKTYINSFILIVSVLSILRPVRDFYYVVESLMVNQPEHYFFNYRRNADSFVRYFDSSNVFSKKTFMPVGTIETISKVKEIVRNARAKNPDKPINLLNISELTPLSLVLEATSAVKVPLWFHSGISLFPREILSISERISANEFDIILLQAAHENFNPIYSDMFNMLNDSTSYVLVQTVYDTPANSTSKCERDCDGNIYIYFRNDLM